VPCPTLITLGSIEVENSMAFRGAHEAVAMVRGNALQDRLTVQTVAGADHFYSGVRPDLIAGLETWLR
jgi:hypothetical protein